jgi:ribulose kinase
MLALCGAGLVDSLEDAVEKMVNVVETRQPDASIQAHYEDCYQQYREAYFTLLPYFEQKAKKEK